ncbi:MAG: C10 family peptidase [Candidatus Delongbacteria bacterium]|nr:C10 family peptidase [Candidatus Delongbacteria bacterium]MBN2833662.1 C10 family peptidase [Candidatus Delongbacteria bacterium]
MKLIIILTIVLTMFLNARTINQEVAEKVANSFIKNNNLKLSEVKHTNSITSNGQIVAYMLGFNEVGFIIISSDDLIDPVIAFSETCSIDVESPLVDLVKSDLSKRFKYHDEIDGNLKEKIREKWENLLSDNSEMRTKEQWPAAGSTSTGGWTITKWNQTSPYNMYCPIDKTTNQRSITGCPATAMAQILVYLKTVNSTSFNTNDRYFHNYTNQFWVDDDYETFQFLSFSEINESLDLVQKKLSANEPLSNSDKAVLSLACGFACKSVYSSGGSGTFGVIQAYDAYQKFGFKNLAFLTSANTDDEIREKMIENIKEGYPVHLATVNEQWTTGHNVVCDGYREDGFFRLNMGWGGYSDGWYSLPEGFPLNLTVFEGIVADIKPVNLLNQPESVEYFDDQNLYLVSNWGSGEIVSIDQNGVQNYFNQELNKVAGIKIFEDKLFCCDSNRVAIIDLSTKIVENFIDIEGSSLLNDLVFYENFIFVSDYWDPKIYRVDMNDYSYEIFIQEDDFVPNGMYYDEDSNRILGLVRNINGSLPRVVSIDPSNGEMEIVVYTHPYYSLDGIAKDLDGNYYVSSWCIESASVHGIIKFNPNFENPQIIADNCSGPADIFINDNLMAIPNLNSNSIDFRNLSVGISENQQYTIVECQLNQNYPNPFNPVTNISFSVSKRAIFSLIVFDICGREIDSFNLGDFEKGTHSFKYNCSNLASGVYFYQLRTNDYVTAMKRMIVLK